MLFLAGTKLTDIDGHLRDLWASLCQVIYSLIAWLYELFINLSSVKLLTQSDIKPIYQRVTIILTIIMIFYVTLEVVKYIIEPDHLTDKEKGATKIVQKMVIVILLIAFVPTIFEKAYDLQNSLVKNQVFSKIILGEENKDASTYGRTFSSSLFGMFYYYDAEGLKEYGLDPDEEKCEDVSCAAIVELNLNHLKSEGRMPLIHVGLNERTKKVTVNGLEVERIRKITFDGLLAVIIGAIIVYMLVLYCIDVGVRIAQMLFLQIVAPIPIIGYMAPKKDGIFQKWVKQCVTTYLDLFIRLIIIYFVMLITGILMDAFHSGTLLNNVGEVSRTMKVFMYVFLILGLMMFAQKAPKMLQELFPKMGAASGNFGLKAGERVAPMAARAIGAGVGGVNALVRAGVTRGRNVHRRNKDLKEKLREEGKPTDRKSMRDARRAAYKDMRSAKKTKTQREKDLDKASKEYHEANRELEKARKKGLDTTELEKKVAQKEAIYEAKRKGYDTTNVNRTKSNLDNANKEYQEARDRKAAAQRDGSYDSMSDEDKRKLDSDIEIAKSKRDAAEEEHNEAVKTDKLLRKDSKESIQARETLEDLKRQRELETDPAKQKELDDQIKDASAKYDEELAKANSGYLAGRRDYETKRSTLAEERNNTYGAYAGVQAAGAAIAGMATGMAAGAKATKLGDIRKNVSQGSKNVQQSEAKKVQYLEDHGSATFSGTVDRVIAREQQQFGFRTESERIKEEVKNLERRSKNLNSQASMEGALKNAQDEAENRAQSKLEKKEQKIQMTADDEIKIKGSDGKEIASIKPLADADGKYETTSQMYMRYEQQANTAKTEADAANEAYTKAMMEGKRMVEKVGPDGTKTSVEETDEEFNNRVNGLKTTADEKAKAAEDAKYMQTQVLKKLKEYAVTRALRGDIPTGQEDVVLDTKIRTMKVVIDNARANARTVEFMRSALASKPEMFQAFMANNIVDYDTYDTIQGLLTGHSTDLKDESGQISEQIRAINESFATDAANAAAAAGKPNK